MVVVAQLVRVPDCGSGGRRFEPGLPPKKLRRNSELFYFNLLSCEPFTNKKKSLLGTFG